MRPAQRHPFLTLSISWLMCLPLLSWAASPSGRADPGFVRPELKMTAFPGRAVADGRGGLLWTFANGTSLDGANGLRKGTVIRTFESGVLDTNYATGPALRDALALVVQPDGKALVGATVVGDVTPTGIPNYRIFRLLTNGVIDNSYSSPVFDGALRYMTLTTDGKLIVGGPKGSVDQLGNGGILHTVRLNSDGSLDASFNSPIVQGPLFTGGVFGPPALDTNGLIYLVGGFTNVNGSARPGVARLLPNGFLDDNFAPTGFSSGLFARGVVIQNDGRVVIGGRFRKDSDPANDYALLRLNQDGSLDNSFNLVRVQDAGFIRTRLLRQTSDGKLLGVSLNMTRFNADGTRDNTFINLPFLNSYENSSVECFWFELVTGEKIVVPPSLPVEVAAAPVSGAFRLNQNGSRDFSFTPPLFQTEVYPTEAAVQNDGRSLIWGQFDQVGATSRSGIARFNTNGVLDAAYNLNIFDLLSVSSASLLPDNTLYAVLTHGDDVTLPGSNSLAHVFANGQLDTNFQPGVTFPLFQVFPPSLFVQDGKPIVWWNHEQDVVDNKLPFYRLHPSGSLDPSFQAPTNRLGTSSGTKMATSPTSFRVVRKYWRRSPRVNYWPC